MYKFLEKETNIKKTKIDSSLMSSVIYHNIFDYPLKIAELDFWKVGKGQEDINFQGVAAQIKQNYIFVLGRENLIAKRIFREKISREKIKIAISASYIIGKIPSVECVMLTGALCMKNADFNSDIDLFIITKKNTLWSTRPLVYLVLKLCGFKLRRAHDSDQKDRLCLNMWAEGIFSWEKPRRNIFTAHEILQMHPLVNKNNIYEKFILKNKWVKDYWPNAYLKTKKRIVVNHKSKKYLNEVFVKVLRALNYFLFKIQYKYMKNKITNETIKKQKAFFHPVNWSDIVLTRLKKG